MGNGITGLEVTDVKLKGAYTGRVSVSESDYENAAIHKDLSIIRFDEIDKVINSTNIISDWYKYRVHASERMYDSKYPLYFIINLKQTNTRAAFIDHVARNGFPKLDTAEKIIEHLQKKIKLFKTLIEKYRNSLAEVSKNYNISATEYKSLLKDIDSGRYDKVYSKTFVLLTTKKSDYTREWGLDFTKFGGGKVFANKEENIWDMIKAEGLYNMSLTNDIVIYCHGTDVTSRVNLNQAEVDLADKLDKCIQNGAKNPKEAIKQLNLTAEEKEILRKYKPNKLMRFYRAQIKEFEDRYGSEFGILCYYRDRILGDIKKQWGFGSALKTPYGTFRDVNECIRACIANGAKKIKILACNPGHYMIAKDIRKMPDVEVDYQINSVFIESTDIVNLSRSMQTLLETVETNE